MKRLAADESFENVVSSFVYTCMLYRFYILVAHFLLARSHSMLQFQTSLIIQILEVLSSSAASHG